MTRFAAVLVLAMVVLASCKKTPEPEPAAARTAPIVSDGTALGNMAEKVDRLMVKTDLAMYRGLVRNWSVEKGGGFPSSLADLARDGQVKYPDEYQYDSATGVVTSKSYPGD